MTEPHDASSRSARRQLLARLLQERINGSGGQKGDSPHTAGGLSPFWPLSYGQRALWELEQQARGTAVNTEAFAWRHQGALDLPGLQAAYVELTARHPCLQTTYSLHAGQPMQRFHPLAVPTFDIVGAEGCSQEELRQQVTADAHRPWDLERGPVFQVHIYRCSSWETIVLTRIHHLVIDLWSMAILLEDFQHLYLTRQLGAVSQLTPLPANYRDFVSWQQQLVQGPDGEWIWQYWRQQLAGRLSGLNLPTDHPRPPMPTYRGATLPVQLGEDLTLGLRALAREEQTTLFTVLLAALQVLMGRLTGQQDVLVGSRVAGRSRPEFERLVGYFANSIALRADLSGNPTFRSVLRQVRQTVQEALTHQDYPYSLLRSRLASPSAPAQPPLCNVVFVLQKPHGIHNNLQQGVPSFGIASQAEVGAYVAVGNNRFEIFPVELQVARHDLEMEMVQVNNTVVGWLRYSLDLFTAPTVACLIGNYVSLLEAIVTFPDRQLADLALADLTVTAGL